MRCFTALSRLLRIENEATIQKCYFHFKGMYEGNYIQEIVVEAKGEEFMEIGQDYLLYLGFRRIDEGLLKARLIKIKSLKKISA